MVLDPIFRAHPKINDWRLKRSWRPAWHAYMFFFSPYVMFNIIIMIKKKFCFTMFSLIFDYVKIYRFCRVSLHERFQPRLQFQQYSRTEMLSHDIFIIHDKGFSTGWVSPRVENFSPFIYKGAWTFSPDWKQFFKGNHQAKNLDTIYTYFQSRGAMKFQPERM